MRFVIGLKTLFTQSGKPLIQARDFSQFAGFFFRFNAASQRHYREGSPPVFSNYFLTVHFHGVPPHLERKENTTWLIDVKCSRNGTPFEGSTV
jgi:hypothetical protein